jgi:translation elongation factor EF-1beta
VLAHPLVRSSLARLEAMCFGLKKLVINAHVEDDKISTDVLEEKILEFDELVQSVDIAAFNKL